MPGAGTPIRIRLSPEEMVILLLGLGFCGLSGIDWLSLIVDQGNSFTHVQNLLTPTEVGRIVQLIVEV